MHVIVYEPNPHGHRFTHVKRLVPALAGVATKVTLVTSREGAASQEYAVQLKGVESCFALEASMPLGDASDKGYLKHLAANLKRCARDLGAQHVLMPYADGTIQTAGMMRLGGQFSVPTGVEIEGLLMRGAFAYDTRRGLKAWARRRAWLMLTGAAPFGLIHHMDPLVVRAIQRESPGLARRVELVPDPVEAYSPPSRREARKRLGIPEDGRYIGCVGLQDTRKGIDRLIRAFLAAKTAPDDRLLLMGGHAKEIKDILAGEAAQAVSSGRIVSMARYITDEELCLGVAAMDVVATPYPPDGGHSGSSSIVIHAAGQGRMTLGCDFGWVGDTILRFHLGEACNVLDQGVFASAITSSLEKSVTFTLSEGGRRFVEFHRPENFVACFTRRFRERAGAPPAPALRRWAWVLEAGGRGLDAP